MRIRAFTSALKAGWIAHRCTNGCFVDDVNQQIIPCSDHAMAIARLAEINAAAQ